MIGAKSVTSALLLVVVSALALGFGATPAKLAELGAVEAFAVGFFALLVGGFLFRYFRLHRRSTYYLRHSVDELPWGDESHFLGTEHRRILVGENRGDAYDFSPRIHYLIYVALAAWTALLTLDSRAIAALRALPEDLAAQGSEYCPELRSPSPTAANTQEEPGCALIRRAYELGYVKNLGPCAAITETARLESCTLRQHDEPILHYAWRRLVLFETAARAETSSERFAESKADFERRLDHLPELFEANRFTVASAARASHHIFTNLPNPGGWLSRAHGPALDNRDCETRYRRLPSRLESTSASRHLEHVVAQLLFDTRYAPAVGSCRELTIHWDSPPDICDRLVKSPLEVLDDAGALGEVRNVLERYRVTAELQEVLPAAEGMSKLSGILRSVTRQRFVSFGCYIEEERASPQFAVRELTLEGQRFTAPEARVPIADSDDAHKYVASMLVPSFHYGNLLSEASSGDPLAAGVDAKFFTGQYGYLSRLDYLKDVDIFLGHDWIEERPDLMEVYPYHVHLGNYVATFRSRYRAERGRL
jgi:hypothetical protein